MKNVALATWAAMCAGTCGIGPITHFDTDAFAVKVAAEVKGFDGNEYFGKRDAKHLDPCVQFALAASDEAMHDAGFDVELVEKHHNKKLDAPSGTALALADSIKEVLGSDYFHKFDRSGERAQRNPKEIGISAVRGGTIVGEHEVIFAGEDEVIEFKHTAYSKAIFGKGAIEAAKFLAGKPAGKYDMADVIEG